MAAQHDKLEIISQKKISDRYFRLSVRAPALARAAQPGQFVMVKVSDTDTPLLRRPLGIHSVKGSGFSMLYEGVGVGTQLLSRKKAGDALDIIGPLGNSFNTSLIPHPSSLVLVAGGMGVAPLLFLAEHLRKNKPIVLLGARTKSQILCEPEFKKLDCEVRVATDDGSRGTRGTVTALLSSLLTTLNLKLPTVVYACGPHPMLASVTAIAKKYRVPAYGSFEAHMACGIGACMGCVIKTKTGYARVCKDGPVFPLNQVIF